MLSTAVRRASAASAGAGSGSAPLARRLGTASFPHNVADPDYVVFPREAPGLSYDLNWSLADDNVTPKGSAFRNASVKELLQHCTGRLSASKAIDCGDAVASDVVGPFATDDYAGHASLSIDDYEAALEDVCDGLSRSSALFVEDAAVGSTREAQVRLRVISDSPEYALVMRNLLVRTPLYHPEAFPRPIVVYVASKAQAAFTASDFDPEGAKATVVASGLVPAAAIRAEISHVAGLLMDTGGYRHARGGGPRVQAAREDGDIEWYVGEDRYHVAGAEEPHPDLVRVRASASVASNGAVTLVVDGSASRDSFAGHDVVWTSSGVARMFDGVMTAAAHGDDLPAGSITFQGATTVALPSTLPPAAGHPKEIAVAGGDLAAALGLTDTQAEKLDARVQQHGVKVVRA